MVSHGREGLALFMAMEIPIRIFSHLSKLESIALKLEVGLVLTLTGAYSVTQLHQPCLLHRKLHHRLPNLYQQEVVCKHMILGRVYVTRKPQFQCFRGKASWPRPHWASVTFLNVLSPNTVPLVSVGLHHIKFGGLGILLIIRQITKPHFKKLCGLERATLTIWGHNPPPVSHKNHCSFSFSTSINLFSVSSPIGLSISYSLLSIISCLQYKGLFPDSSICSHSFFNWEDDNNLL